MIPRCSSFVFFLAIAVTAAQAGRAQANSGSVTAATARVTVGSNIQISAAHPTRRHSEFSADADPADPNRLLACVMVTNRAKAGFDTITYLSKDGGASWRPVHKYDFSPYTADPACAFGAQEQVTTAALGREIDENNRYRTKVWVHHSQDGGRSWNGPIRLPQLDRDMLTSDRSGGPYHGRFYLHGAGSAGGITESAFDGVTLFWSDDGKLWSQGLSQFATPGHAIFGMGNATVLADGTFLAIFGELGGAGPSAALTLRALRSTNGGESFEPAATISYWINPAASDAINTAPYVAADVSDSPFRGRVYAVWTDARYGGSSILLAYSADQGRSWSEPIVANDDSVPPGARRRALHFAPTVAVNRNGVVAVSWADRRHDPEGISWTTRIAASLDGGETVEPSVAVSSVPSTFHPDDFELASRNSGGGSRYGGSGGAVTLELLPIFDKGIGHYVAFPVGADGVFHPIWNDTRTGVPQLWTAAVRIAGRAVKHGDPRLSSLTDVSDFVTLDPLNPHYDATTETLTTDIVVGNTSKQTISGKLLVRLTKLSSWYGNIALETSDGGPKGVGAIWDFTALVPNGKLAPGESTRPKRLVFKLQNVTEDRTLGGQASWLLTRTRIYAQEVE